MNATGTTDTTQLPQGIKRAPIMICLIIGAFFAILNETLLNVAFFDLMAEFQVDATKIQWLATGFMLVVGVLVPVTALLVQWLTTRQMFLGAMILFALGTLIAGFSPSFPVLLVGRLIQAAGTGLLLPVMMNTILVMYAPGERGSAMGMMGLVIMFAPAIGPTLSGVILEALNWRWLFFVVVPFALFSIVFAFIYLRNLTPVTRPKISLIAIALSTIGFGGVVFGFSKSGELQQTGQAAWSAPEVYGPLVIGIVALLVFVLHQLKAREPILNLRTFKFPMFALSAVILILMMMVLFSTLLIIPLFLRGALLMSAFAAGLALLPGGVLNGLMSPITGKLFDKLGPRWLAIPGSIVLVGATFLFSQVSADTSMTVFVILHCLLMIGISMIMMPVQTNGLNQLPPAYYPHGTAILNTLQQVAGAIGVALFMSIMTGAQQRHVADAMAKGAAQNEELLMGSFVAGAHQAFFIGMLVAVAVVVLTLFMRRTGQQSTPQHVQDAGEGR